MGFDELDVVNPEGKEAESGAQAAANDVSTSLIDLQRTAISERLPKQLH